MLNSPTALDGLGSLQPPRSQAALTSRTSECKGKDVSSTDYMMSGLKRANIRFGRTSDQVGLPLLLARGRCVSERGSVRTNIPSTPGLASRPAAEKHSGPRGSYGSHCLPASSLLHHTTDSGASDGELSSFRLTVGSSPSRASIRVDPFSSQFQVLADELPGFQIFIPALPYWTGPDWPRPTSGRVRRPTGWSGRPSLG